MDARQGAVTRHLPNLLSAARLLAAPFAAWLILQGHDTAALLVFAAAGASDGLDGFIARRWGYASRFGAWLDPLADKLLMLLCLTALHMAGMTPLWLLALVLARDLAIVTGWLCARLLGLPLKLEPLFIGKLSTAMQIVYVLALLVMLAFDLELPLLVKASAGACGLLTLASAAAYAGLFLRGLLAGHRAVR